MKLFVCSTLALLVAALLAPAAFAQVTAVKNTRFAGDAVLAQVAAGQTSLRSGAKGPAVAKLQQALLDLGFALKPYPSRMTGRPVGGIDGAFGGQMTAALQNFQWHASVFWPAVRADGVLDRATLLALDALAPSLGKQAWSPGEVTKTPVPRWQKRWNLRVVVVKREHRTFVFDAQGKLQGIYSNAVGAVATQTHSGLKMIASKMGLAETQAVGKKLWNDPRAFGDRILNLSWSDGRASGEELHGTYAYDRLGYDVSHGCARHYNEDIITMFGLLNNRDLVAIVDTLNDINLIR